MIFLWRISLLFLRSVSPCWQTISNVLERWLMSMLTLISFSLSVFRTFRLVRSTQFAFASVDMSDRSREKIYGADASDRHCRVLRLKIIRAVDLQRRDFLGGSGDPYVKIALQERDNRGTTIDAARTRTVPKTLNPLWNQDFLFRVCRTSSSCFASWNFFAGGPTQTPSRIRSVWSK